MFVSFHYSAYPLIFEALAKRRAQSIIYSMIGFQTDEHQLKLKSLAAFLFLALSVASVPLRAETQGESKDVFIVPKDGKITGRLAGSPATLGVLGDGLSYPVIDPMIARQRGLRSSIFAVQARVGATRIAGSTGITSLSIGSVTFKRRALWFERPIVVGYDAILGPDSFPNPIVELTGDAEPTGQKVRLPLVRNSGKLGTNVKVGGHDIFVMFDLQSRDSVATAGAATVIAKDYFGQFVGGQQGRNIKFGIYRPVRTLQLERNFNVGPVSLRRLTVRVSDFGSTSGITDKDQDPSEIVIQAKGKAKQAEYSIVLGKDALGNCASIRFEKENKLLVLDCHKNS